MAHLNTPHQPGQPRTGNRWKYGIAHQLPCLFMPPPACNLAGYAQTAPKDNLRVSRFIGLETLTKHSTGTAQRGQSGSCSSSRSGQKVSSRNHRSWERGNISSCSSLFWLRKSSGPLGDQMWTGVSVSPEQTVLWWKFPECVFCAIYSYIWTLLVWEKLKKSSFRSPKKFENQSTPDGQGQRKGGDATQSTFRRKLCCTTFQPPSV